MDRTEATFRESERGTGRKRKVMETEANRGWQRETACLLLILFRFIFHRNCKAIRMYVCRLYFHWTNLVCVCLTTSFTVSSSIGPLLFWKFLQVKYSNFNRNPCNGDEICVRINISSLRFRNWFKLVKHIHLIYQPQSALHTSYYLQ